MTLIRPARNKNRKWSRDLKRQIVQEYSIAQGRKEKSAILDRYQITATHIRYWMMLKRKGTL